MAVGIMGANIGPSTSRSISAGSAYGSRPTLGGSVLTPGVVRSSLKSKLKERQTLRSGAPQVSRMGSSELSSSLAPKRSSALIGFTSSMERSTGRGLGLAGYATSGERKKAGLSKATGKPEAALTRGTLGGPAGRAAKSGGGTSIELMRMATATGGRYHQKSQRSLSDKANTIKEAERARGKDKDMYQLLDQQNRSRSTSHAVASTRPGSGEGLHNLTYATQGRSRGMGRSASKRRGSVGGR